MSLFEKLKMSTFFSHMCCVTAIRPLNLNFDTVCLASAQINSAKYKQVL